MILRYYETDIVYTFILHSSSSSLHLPYHIPISVCDFIPSSIIEKNGGKAPLTYHQFQTVVASMETPPQAEPTIDQHFLHGAYTPIGEDHDEKYGVPTLEELG
jgi:hypothetical protein